MNMMNLKEIKEFLSGKDDNTLFHEADKVRLQIFGKDVYIRGIIEFSNMCREDCLYCGLRKSNRKLKRYQLTMEEILEGVELAGMNNIKTIILQSGDDLSYNKELIGKLIEEIKKRLDVVITLSLGERTYDEYAYWREKGAERYLLKIETFDEELYKKMRPGKKLEDRLQRLEWLKELDYEVGSGIIIGLPGQDLDSLTNDLRRLAELDLDMIATGPFIPHPETPLRDYPHGDVNLSIRVIALLRIMNPYSNIPATSALASLHSDAREKGLKAGANVIMPSLTPKRVRLLYNIYPGKNESCQCVIDEINYIKGIIEKAGYIPSDSKGYSPRRLYA